jgi:hypothetical protein
MSKAPALSARGASNSVVHHYKPRPADGKRAVKAFASQALSTEFDNTRSHFRCREMSTVEPESVAGQSD